MKSKAIRRLVVVSDKGSLVGILTVDDILDLLADEMTRLVREKRYKS